MKGTRCAEVLPTHGERERKKEREREIERERKRDRENLQHTSLRSHLSVRWKGRAVQKFSQYA
jgi:hypothetical protein